MRGFKVRATPVGGVSRYRRNGRLFLDRFFIRFGTRILEFRRSSFDSFVSTICDIRGDKKYRFTNLRRSSDEKVGASMRLAFIILAFILLPASALGDSVMQSLYDEYSQRLIRPEPYPTTERIQTIIDHFAKTRPQA